MGRYFDRVFLPNRGVIAVRAIRTLHDLGITAVVGHSDCDRFGLAVRMADEARRLGPAPASTSYLDAERIIQVAADAGCDALFPGYGFLSENADFADACLEAGITFIGPPPEVLRRLAHKDRARRALSDAGFDVLPGIGAVSDPRDIAEFAGTVGYPLLIKPTSGAGGLGTARIDGPGEIAAQLDHARSVATIAFGDDSVCVEKWVDPAAAISVQFVADRQGNAVHLGEREGSIQHSYGKLIDEAPSTKLDGKTRAQLGARVARAMANMGYVTAGTVEFLLDSEGGMYAIEANPRIQVEHVVTEMITGVDIIELMVRTAAGEPLPMRQEDVEYQGHAVQFRVKAEDPGEGFRPSFGKVTHLEIVDEPHVRHDVGIHAGCDVPMYYDPLLLKVCAVGEDRATAIQRLEHSLHGFHIRGLKTTAALGRRILEHPAFLDGSYDTSFLDRYLDELLATRLSHHGGCTPCSPESRPSTTTPGDARESSRSLRPNPV